MERQEIGFGKAMLLIVTLVGVLMLMGLAWPSNANAYNLPSTYSQVVD